MEHHSPRDHATSNVLAWTAAHSANVEPSVEEDAGADADEPPDRLARMSHLSTNFQRTPVRRASEQHESLLTKGLQSQSDDDTNGLGSLRQLRRQRSITSNTSCASTANSTCTSGITTPARTSSPSPRLPNAGFVSLAPANSKGAQPQKDPAVQALEKKRCISFACAAKPKPDERTSMPPTADRNERKPEVAQKKTCIRFACPQPPRTAYMQRREARPPTPVPRATQASPSTPKASSTLEKPRSPSTIGAFRSSTSRRNPGSPVAIRNKRWLTADSKDLDSECVRFHEFASGESVEEDWIRRDDATMKPKLTINDTLKKENDIRKLGKEAEEEAELEEEIDEEEDEEVDEADLIDDEDDEDDSGDAEEGDDVDDEVDDLEDEEGLEDGADTEHAWDEEASDGYKTDSEFGFAESDDEDDDLVLWTTRIGHYRSLLSGAVSGIATMSTLSRRPSLGGNSDSSSSSNRKSALSRKKRSKTRPVSLQPATHELPDSTDFVCGTFDEDKPLEEAYISRVERRRRERQQPIPQDIDPSFPTSDPEDEAEELYKKGNGESDDHLWLHGEFEDLHHERDRRGRKKGPVPSPKRCRSPPPKLKSRGHSPKKLYDQRSPRLRSPAPPRLALKLPVISPVHDCAGLGLKPLAFGPHPMQAKSLPKAPSMIPHLKVRRPRGGTITNEAHVRGAIDIVKGLEQKRQRRKEKFYQKYYNRARKEKAQTRRPPPGQGAERMRELGLFMAGKVGHGNYVLSI
ncbi:uncharacterized protein B0T15DRAFT_293927 [Chaetomium strumarium]|uniref:Uncharacterized protein n=1 Tax=Chaetomium strumarium TaxID=1170767 RepID=A0AAJ0GM05_9PEZI|nr:hypothetical protein B0T15DRAFT_293927 [Chaetomium strumarium]